MDRTPYHLTNFLFGKHPFATLLACIFAGLRIGGM
ncbi:hypothetical protein J2X35_001078 [Mesorhizobium sp. BE184]|nr:hypothetical protein [Mesorhizobium sp. BE184]